LLGLLDMSAAFDTVDHKILLKRLEVSFGITGQAQFLSDGQNTDCSILWQQIYFAEIIVWCSAGFCLRSSVFALYSADVIHIAAKHEVCIHAYADDLQTYISCAACDQITATSCLLTCVSDIDRWMSSNRLKLNASKTEFTWLGTRQQLAKLNMSPLQIKDQVITPLDKVRDLDVIINSKLTMESHTANIVRSCFYQLRQLPSIWRSLTTDALCTLATAFVANRVDYCNAVLYGTSTSVKRRLQLVLNAAARMVVGIGKYEHITPVLRDTLHWLPVTVYSSRSLL